MRKLFINLFLLFSVTIFQITGYAKTKDAKWNIVYNSQNNVLLNGIYFLDDNVGYVVGANGTILKTVDGGGNWTSQNSGVTTNLQDVFFVNQNVGFAVGNKSSESVETVIKTTDGGNTWTLLTMDDVIDKRNFYGVCFTDENNGVVVGDAGVAVHTTDGGNTWTRQNIAGSNTLFDITFVNSTTGIAVGNNSKILKTTDGGATWSEKNSGNTGISHVCFPSSNVGYVVGVGGLIKKTTDGGETWSLPTMYFVGYGDLTAVAFLDENHGYISAFDDAYEAVMLETTDGGATWNEVSNSYPENASPFFSMIYTSANVGYALSDFAILKTGASTASGGTINGKVTNALDGTPIAGALVEIAGLSTTTDSEGNYEISGIPQAVLNAAFTASPVTGNAPLQVNFTDQSSDGAHTLIVSKEGFSTYENNQVVIADGETLTMDVSLSPNLNQGELRIVLNWGSEPRDLDSYLKTPTIEGTEYTISYNNHGSETAPPYATLDHDDQDGYGPETITIYQSFPGTYRYFVHKYAGNDELINSNAVVQVYSNSGLLASVNVPTEGTGSYWNVLTIDGSTGAISIINQIVDTPPDKSLKLNIKKNSQNRISLAKSKNKTITSWYWDFGDGSTSTEENPSHIYTNAGTYTVTLTVSNGTNSDTEIKTDYITVNSTGGVILEENFDGAEFPPANWTQTITNSSYTWMQGNPQDNSFSGIDPTNVYSALCPWVAADQNEWLITPEVTLPNDNITLTFYAGYSTNWLTSATLKLNVSVDGGATWTQVWEAENDGGDWAWRSIEITLNDYANQNVKLAWQYIGNDGDLVGIDNVKLTYGTVGVNDETETLPTKFNLSQNYPNPFNPTTVINYSIPQSEFVTITVYNMLGQKVADIVNKAQNAGVYKVNFDGRNLASGTYIYRIKAGNFVEMKKMLLLK